MNRGQRSLTQLPVSSPASAKNNKTHTMQWTVSCNNKNCKALFLNECAFCDADEILQLAQYRTAALSQFIPDWTVTTTFSDLLHARTQPVRCGKWNARTAWSTRDTLLAVHVPSSRLCLPSSDRTQTPYTALRCSECGSTIVSSF